MHLISLGAELRERGVKLRRVDSSVIVSRVEPAPSRLFLW